MVYIILTTTIAFLAYIYYYVYRKGENIGMRTILAYLIFTNFLCFFGIFPITSYLNDLKIKSHKYEVIIKNMNNYEKTYCDSLIYDDGKMKLFVDGKPYKDILLPKTNFIINIDHTGELYRNQTSVVTFKEIFWLRDEK